MTVCQATEPTITSLANKSLKITLPSYAMQFVAIKIYWKAVLGLFHGPQSSASFKIVEMNMEVNKALRLNIAQMK